MVISHTAAHTSLWLQHLCLAAARPDPWAHEVLQLLLTHLPPKLLSPKNMRQVYKAACKTGNPAVLLLLLQWLLEKHPKQAEQREQMGALLRGAAAAGDYGVLRDLLACGEMLKSSSGGSSRDGQVNSSSNGASSGSTSISSAGEHGSDSSSRGNQGSSGSSSGSSSHRSQHYLPSLDWGMLLPRQWLDAILDALPALEPMTESWRWKHTTSRDKGVQYQLAMADLLLYAAGRLGGFKPAVLAQELNDIPEGSLAVKGSKDGWHKLRLVWLRIDLWYSKLKFLEGGPLAAGKFMITGQTSAMVLQEVQEYRRQQGGRKVLEEEGESDRNVSRMSLCSLGCFREQVERAFGEGDAAAVKWLALWQQYQALGSRSLITKWFPLDDKAVAHPKDSPDLPGARRYGYWVDKRWMKSLNQLARELQLPWDMHWRLLQPLADEHEVLVGEALENIGKLQEDIKKNRVWGDEMLQQRGAWGEVPDVIKQLVVRVVGVKGDGQGTGNGSSSSRAVATATNSSMSTGVYGIRGGSGRSHVQPGSSDGGVGSRGGSSLDDDAGSAAGGDGGADGGNRLGSEGQAELGLAGIEGGGVGGSSSEQQGRAGSSDMSSDDFTQAVTALLVWLHNLQTVFSNILSAYWVVLQQMQWVTSAWGALPSSEDIKGSGTWLLSNIRPLPHPEALVVPASCPVSTSCPSTSSSCSTTSGSDRSRNGGSGSGGCTGDFGNCEERLRNPALERKMEGRGGLLYDQLVQQHVEQQYEAKRVKEQLARAARYQQQQQEQQQQMDGADVSGTLGEGLPISNPAGAAAGGAGEDKGTVHEGSLDTSEVDLKGPFEVGDLCFHTDTWRALKHIGSKQGIGEMWLDTLIKTQEMEQMLHLRANIQDADGNLDLGELISIYYRPYVGDDAAQDVLNGLPALVLPLAAKVPECLGCLEEGLPKAWSYVEQTLGELEGKLRGQLNKMAFVRSFWKGLEEGVKEGFEVDEGRGVGIMGGRGVEAVEVKAQQQQQQLDEQGMKEQQQQQQQEDVRREDQQQQEEEQEGEEGQQQQQEEEQGGEQQQQQQDSGENDQQQDSGENDQQQDPGENDQQQDSGENDQQQDPGENDQQQDSGENDQQQDSGENDQQQQQQQRGPLMLKQQLLLQCFTLPGMCTEGDAATLFRVGLRNQLNDFVAKAARHQRVGDPNWVVPKWGVRASVLDVVREALCFADGKLLQQCVEIIKERQATGDDKVWGVREEEQEEDGGEFGYGELVRALPPFRWLCRHQQEWWLRWYRETEEEVERVGRQVRYQPQLDHGALQPRAEPRQWEGCGWVPGEAAVAEEVLEGVLQLLDAPDSNPGMLSEWLGKLKPGSTAEDVAVVRELMVGLGAREKLPVGATWVGFAVREERLWVKGMVDVLGAMVTWYGKARVAERELSPALAAELGEDGGEFGGGGEGGV